MTELYIRKVVMPDLSYFWRGECNGCDWLYESLQNKELHSKAEVHMKVFHNGGMIKHPGFEIEVIGHEV